MDECKPLAYDTQILQWVLSYDGVRSTDALAITAASAATAISDVPFKKPVVGRGLHSFTSLLNLSRF